MNHLPTPERGEAIGEQRKKHKTGFAARCAGAGEAARAKRVGKDGP